MVTNKTLNFANISFFAKFAKLLVHETFPLYGMLRFRVQCVPTGINRCKPVILLRHQATTVSLEKAESKPFDTIPREKGLPYFGTFLNNIFAFRFSKFFLIPLERIKKHGKIWVEQPFPGVGEIVNIVDYRDVQQVFRAEGKTPHRLSIPGFQDVRTASAGPDGELGVLFS